ncbi:MULTISPECIES: thiol peroxidase [Streptococcus]|uniref:Thiol peroxidase n=1 Tax=Streptococcus ruminantium TaxID=1917441 RepID=A0A2Z5TP47_9STRE|nr:MULTISPECIES: thiol peroxidase [Streptococcus]MDQ8759738.1 thiol peroxidase [Streptococcus ruminantium]MDQ8767259.1 thiol peroxidase [Streptococcus ruminantium]MDQ8769701.1 thiol peroxidase [Streptococcus ruminantium]MDQ8775679.1 thiol peroxidase [Streptococcus ruminantium]MDQ8780348.1 thiol peroxidase [Streptococcus ruminantium]
MTTFIGKAVTLVGPRLQVGDKAPDFVLMANDLSLKSLNDFGKQTKVISVVPSIDTGVCDAQTRRFNQDLAERDNTVVITVSVDLPFAQKRWCGAAGLEDAVTLSDYYDHAFGKSYGVLMQEWNLLARAVFVLNAANEIIYVEYLDNVNEQPNYEAALAVLN